MKRFCLLTFILCITITFSACTSSKTETENGGSIIKDAFGNSEQVPKGARVVSGVASFTDMWLLSGGKLVGVTEDAVTERGLDVGKEAEIVGTVKYISLEKVVSLEPDYLILSADIPAHLALKDSLDAMEIPYGYFREDTFSEYKGIMSQFCKANGREDLYEKNVLDVEKKIEAIKSRIPQTDSTVLLIRAFSTGMKAKVCDNLAGQILKEFGLLNIAEGNNAMLEDLSVEHIIKSDPDYIFVTTMGSEEGAINYIRENAQNNPAWSGLSAIENGRFYILPKQLFHYKPNNRWSESYEYIASILWPQIFNQ